jgi:hypothetical protein
MLPKNLEELNEIRSECYAMVTMRASVSAGSSLLPSPGIDIAADVAILMELIPAINRKFGLSGEQIKAYDPVTKQIVFQVVKGAGLAMIGADVTKTVAMQTLTKVAGRTAGKQVLKFVPIIGWVANAAVGFGAMKFVGNSHVNDCYDVCNRLLSSR